MLIFFQLDEMREKKMMMKKKMQDEKDVGFTVIRVESSVSQLEEAVADTEDDNEDNDGTQEAVTGVTPADRPEEPEEEEADTVATESEVDITTTAEMEPR